MKTFKLLIAGLVVFAFLFTTNVNAQEKWGNSGKVEAVDFEFFCSCANDGAGEMIKGTIVFQTIENSKFEKSIVKGKSLVGQTTGNIYNFNRTETFNPETGRLVMNTRNVSKKTGLVTYWQIIGEAEWFDYGGGNYDWYMDGMKFYCK